MPVKFLIQRFKKRNRKGSEVWIDTVWPSLVRARQHYPKVRFREVMTEW